MEQAARELGQVAARHKLKQLEREKERLPEEERKNASFEVGPSKELVGVTSELGHVVRK